MKLTILQRDILKHVGVFIGSYIIWDFIFPGVLPLAVAFIATVVFYTRTHPEFKGVKNPELYYNIIKAVAGTVVFYIFFYMYNYLDTKTVPSLWIGGPLSILVGIAIGFGPQLIKDGLFARPERNTVDEDDGFPRDYNEEHPSWGKYVRFFPRGTVEDKNFATKTEIVEALGSKYPLDRGADSEWQWAVSQKPDYLKFVDTYHKDVHPDGYLYMGGNLYWGGKGHITTFGQTQSGKGSCLVGPALLSFFNRFEGAPSYIVLDPKGENAAIAGKYLRQAGYDVQVINPFKIPHLLADFGPASFNVFNFFTAESEDFDQFADMIAFAIAPETKKSHAHFTKTARSYIALYIRHMMTQEKEEKNFVTLYKWLRLDSIKRLSLLEDMALNKAFDGDIANEAASIHSQFTSGGREEVESTYSTIRSLTDVFKDQQLRKCMELSDIDIKTIAHQKTAIFICMAPEDFERCQAWLRILFGSILKGLTRHYSKTRKVVLILDEFPTIGYLKEFETLSGFGAGIGAGITMWAIMQNLQQLKKVYPDGWNTILNNSVIKHYINVSDIETAENIEKGMPKIEVAYEKDSAEKKNYTKEEMAERRERAKRLGIDVEDLDPPKPQPTQKRMEPLLNINQIQGRQEDIIVEISGLKKRALFWKVPYWKIDVIKDNAGPNPYRP